MKSLKWEGIGTKNLFSHISTLDPRSGMETPSPPVPTLPPNPDYPPLPVADASDAVFCQTGLTPFNSSSKRNNQSFLTWYGPSAVWYCPVRLIVTPVLVSVFPVN